MPFGFGAEMGAGVGGFDTAGVAVTELAGVEFKDGLYTSLPCVAINSFENLERAWRSCGTSLFRMSGRSADFEEVSEKMSTSNYKLKSEVVEEGRGNTTYSSSSVS